MSDGQRIHARECVFAGPWDSVVSSDDERDGGGDVNGSNALLYAENATSRELQAPSFSSSASRAKTKNKTKLRISTKSKKDTDTNSAGNKAVINVSSRVINHLDSVAISFEISRPSGMDRWIGVYCAEDETPDHDFLDFVKTSYRCKNVLEFRWLPNMRCSWQFRLFRTTQTGGHQQHVRIANGRFEPLQIHLAMTNSPTEMRMMGVIAPVTTPEVYYSSNPEKLIRVVRASASTYAASGMCAEPASIEAAQYFRDPGALYDGLMTDLKSQVYKFFVPLPAGQHDPSKPMSFFVYGGMGDWDIKALGALPDDRMDITAKLMRDDMESLDHQYVVAMHDGDISYAKGHTFLWDQFLALVHPVEAELPYMVEVGDHNNCYTRDSTNTRNDPSLRSIREQKDSTFHPPNQPNDCDSGVYSFEVGLMHHAVISTEHDYTPGLCIFNWLVNDLKRVDREKTQWLLLHIHRPMYCSEMYESGFELSKSIRKNLETLCAEYGVDVVFSGHYHAYERTCPVFQEWCRTEAIESRNTNSTSFSRPLEKFKAPVHIMVESAGASLDSTTQSRGAAWPRWSTATAACMHVYNATHALYEFKHNRDRIIADSVWIIFNHDWHDDILLEALRVSFGQIEARNGISTDAAKPIYARDDTDEDLLHDGIPAPDGHELDHVDVDDNGGDENAAESDAGSRAGVVALDDDLLTGEANT